MITVTKKRTAYEKNDYSLFDRIRQEDDTAWPEQRHTHASENDGTYLLTHSATGRLDGSLCPELIFSHNLFRKSDSMVYLCVTTKMHLS